MKATTFKANPRIKRVVFICTPHRGSKMASGGIGELGIKLISLPVDLETTMKSEIPEETLRKLNNGRLPNSVSNLKPSAPYLAVLNKQSIQAPYHSIIGNRGKPGPLADSTDGVVPLLELSSRWRPIRAYRSRTPWFLRTAANDCRT